MKITSADIRTKLPVMWPNLEYIWMFEQTYWTMNPDALQGAMEASNVHKVQFITGFSECNFFALQVLAEFQRKRYFQWEQGKLPLEERYLPCVGFAWGDQFRGVGRNHVVNIGIGNDDNVYLLDSTPGENRMWIAKPENDNVLFVFM